MKPIKLADLVKHLDENYLDETLTFTHAIESTINYLNFHMENENDTYFKKYDNENRFYLCHDERNLRGTTSPNLFGHNYSYIVEKYRDGWNETFLLYHQVDLHKKEINISNSIIQFIYSFNVHLNEIFYIKTKINEQFASIKMSETQGMVEVTLINNKKISIKLNRLIQKLLNKYNEIVLKNDKNKYGFIYNDKLIEDIHNSYMSTHPSSITYKIVSGDDILIGYNKENYVKGGSTLQNSCMSDKYNYLKLYTDNIDKISLLIFYCGDKICGRTLLWKCDDDKIYCDRLYYGYDWIQITLNNIIDNLCYNRLNDDNKVSLSNVTFDKYPYLDSFYNISFKNKALYYDTRRKNTCKYTLRSTAGKLTTNEENNIIHE